MKVTVDIDCVEDSVIADLQHHFGHANCRVDRDDCHPQVLCYVTGEQKKLAAWLTLNGWEDLEETYPKLFEEQVSEQFFNVTVQIEDLDETHQLKFTDAQLIQGHEAGGPRYYPFDHDETKQYVELLVIEDINGDYHVFNRQFCSIEVA